MNNSICAGIVVYHPDYNRLKQCITSICNQVEWVYCYNNGLDYNNKIEKLINSFSNVSLIGYGSNDGISKAINTIAEFAKERNSKWLLTLDQDSVCQFDMIYKFKNYVNLKNIGLVCPYIIDKRRPLQGLDTTEDKCTEVKFAITSGSMINLEVFNKIGRLDEYLFIGLVDNEYCYRLLLNGYKIVRVNDVVLDHELGNISQSKYANFFLKVGHIIKNEKILALSYKRIVSPMRVYFATRNYVYLSKKYRKVKPRCFTKYKAIINGISNVIRGQNKMAVFKAFCNGYMDGINESTKRNEYV